MYVSKERNGNGCSGRCDLDCDFGNLDREVVKMSELKAFDIVVSEEGYGEGFVKYRRSVYDKSEADKVIVLLKDKANYNEYKYKLKSEELADTCRFYENELRHQKYKRCLLMAKICENKLGTIVKPGWWDKWYKRLLKIAELLKEAK